MSSPARSEFREAPFDAVFVPVVTVGWIAATSSSRLLGAWPAVGGAALLLGCAVAAARPARTRALFRANGRLAAIGALGGALLIGLSYLVQPGLAGLAPFVAAETTDLYAVVRALPAGVAALLLVPVTLGEELVWRGAVQDGFARRVGGRAGVVLAAAAYALATAPMGSALLVGVALAWGVVWGTLRAVTGSLVPAVVAHLAWSLVVVILFPLDGAAPIG